MLKILVRLNYINLRNAKNTLMGIYCITFLKSDKILVKLTCYVKAYCGIKYVARVTCYDFKMKEILVQPSDALLTQNTKNPNWHQQPFISKDL